MALLVALAGGLARAATGDSATQAPALPGTRSFAAELALLRKVASPGGGWAPLRAGVPRAAQAAPAVGVWTSGPGPRVPADFLGLSFEATTLSSLPTLVQGGTLTNLLSSLGRGMLRFGGGSVNRYVAWQQPGTPAPRWATHPVSPRDLQTLAAVTRQTGWKVLLTMNLAHYEPRAVAEEAAAARRELGGGLAGIAIGNEPDRFGAIRPARHHVGLLPVRPPARRLPRGDRGLRRPAPTSPLPTCPPENSRCRGCGNRSGCTPRSSPTTTTR